MAGGIFTGMFRRSCCSRGRPCSGSCRRAPLTPLARSPDSDSETDGEPACQACQIAVYDPKTEGVDPLSRTMCCDPSSGTCTILQSDASNSNLEGSLKEPHLCPSGKGLFEYQFQMCNVHRALYETGKARLGCPVGECLCLGRSRSNGLRLCNYHLQALRPSDSEAEGSTPQARKTSPKDLGGRTAQSSRATQVEAAGREATASSRMPWIISRNSGPVPKAVQHACSPWKRQSLTREWILMTMFPSGH